MLLSAAHSPCSATPIRPAQKHSKLHALSNVLAWKLAQQHTPSYPRATWSSTIT